MTLHGVNVAHYYCGQILMLFGDGEYLQNTPKAICTTENLTRLYRHRLRAVIENKNSLWFPELQA